MNVNTFLSTSLCFFIPQLAGRKWSFLLEVPTSSPFNRLMASGDKAPTEKGIPAEESTFRVHVRRPTPTLGSVLVFNTCDRLSGMLLCCMVVFSPWAFGTSQAWSVATMNVLGYATGILLAIKWLIRANYHYSAPRWTATGPNWLCPAWAALTLLILGYTLLAALNARASYDPLRMEFAFRPHLGWLPHSYDRAKSFQAFANYLALACCFWSFRDWFAGKSVREIRIERNSTPDVAPSGYLPDRIRTMLWLLCLNGALLAIEAIAQRVDGGVKLLWLVETRINREALSQFGPFAYRANAAQYFNLVWPLGLALWWELRRESRRRRESESLSPGWKKALLLTVVCLIAACPVISASRLGAVVGIIGILGAMVIAATGLRQRQAGVKFAIVLFFSTVLALGLYFGWDQLSKRLETTETDYGGREEIYATARQIARDYPLFGTGPGSFESVFPLYRSSADQYWPAQLHNDWLETLVTYGWLGSVMIGLALLCVLSRWFWPGTIQTSWRTAAFIWLALGGCLAHARFDFPFQVYSILHLFLLECALLSLISRRPVHHPSP